jgi:hypothetical protein
MTPRLVAAAVALQIYGGHDPDSSRYLAERVLTAADRADTRGHPDSGPTQTEVARATSELARQGVTASPAQMHRALFAALCPEPFARTA